MFGLGITEIIIIAIVLGILFFGNKKVTEVAKTAGRFSGEFKRSKIEIEENIKKVKKDFEESEKEIK